MNIKRKLSRVLAVSLYVFGASMVVATTPSLAAAPMVKSQAPGFYRMMVGDFEVTVLSDGTVDLPVDKLLTNTTTTEVNRGLNKSFLSSPVQTSVNALLVNTGHELVLIDTGAGALFGPTLGNLVTNLKAAGYEPGQIDHVFITHMHPDHVGGLMSGEQMVFPNATIHADKRDADFWLSQENLDRAPKDSKGFFQGAMASLNPYVKAGHFAAFTEDGELVPGIKSVPTYGHTAGHTSYVIESKGQKLIDWGDLIHVGSVQFDDPSVTIQFDSDAKSAAIQRKRALADAASSGTLIFAAHLPFPGTGHVRSQGKGYTFIPVNYTIVR